MHEKLCENKNCVLCPESTMEIDEENSNGTEEEGLFCKPKEDSDDDNSSFLKMVNQMIRQTLIMKVIKIKISILIRNYIMKG